MSHTNTTVDASSGDQLEDKNAHLCDTKVSLCTANEHLSSCLLEQFSTNSSVLIVQKDNNKLVSSSNKLERKHIYAN